MSSRWIQKRRVRTRSWWLNGTQNIRIRSYLVVVENDISNRIFILIANKRRFKILEILRNFRGDSMISENVGNIEQVQALINKLNGINAMILRPQIFDVIANENTRYKRNELELLSNHIIGERQVNKCMYTMNKFILWNLRTTRLTS